METERWGLSPYAPANNKWRNYMKNIFSYQYGSVFTGKEIKDYLIYRTNKGYSLAGYNQYFRCKDNRLYVKINPEGKLLKESIWTMSVKEQCDLLEKIKNF